MSRALKDLPEIITQLHHLADGDLTVSNQINAPMKLVIWLQR